MTVICSHWVFIGYYSVGGSQAGFDSIIRTRYTNSFAGREFCSKEMELEQGEDVSFAIDMAGESEWCHTIPWGPQPGLLPGCGDQCNATAEEVLDTFCSAPNGPGVAGCEREVVAYRNMFQCQVFSTYFYNENNTFPGPGGEPQFVNKFGEKDIFLTFNDCDVFVDAMGKACGRCADAAIIQRACTSSTNGMLLVLIIGLIFVFAAILLDVFHGINKSTPQGMLTAGAIFIGTIIVMLVPILFTGCASTSNKYYQEAYDSALNQQGAPNINLDYILPNGYSHSSGIGGAFSILSVIILFGAGGLRVYVAQNVD